MRVTMHYLALIIGAGQAGLAAAHELHRRGYSGADGDVLALDANDGRPGHLAAPLGLLTLGKLHGIADLPGLPMNRPAPCRVDRPLTVTLVDDRVFTANLVLNATGTWDNPYIPGIENFRGRQLHTKDYVRKEDFARQRTLVVGGGLSSVQFLLELAPVTETVYHPPTAELHQARVRRRMCLAVEEAVRERTFAGRRPASVVRTTGIPQIPAYLDGVAAGTLVSRGMFDRVTETGVVFEPPKSEVAAGYAPSRSNELQARNPGTLGRVSHR